MALEEIAQQGQSEKQLWETSGGNHTEILMVAKIYLRITLQAYALTPVFLFLPWDHKAIYKDQCQLLDSLKKNLTECQRKITAHTGGALGGELEVCT